MKRITLTVILIILCFAPILEAQGFGYKTWGIHGGFGFEPDQVVVGAQIDMGEVVKQLKFEPGVDLGLGNDVTLLIFSGDFKYLFVDKKVQPYVASALNVTYWSANEHSDTEMGVNVGGGVYLPISSWKGYLDGRLDLVSDAFYDLRLTIGIFF